MGCACLVHASCIQETAVNPCRPKRFHRMRSGVVRAARIELALPKEADFRTTSASAAAPERGVRGLDYPLALAGPALGPARLVSTPSLPGTGRGRAWLGIATGATREVSPNLSGYAPAGFPAGTRASSPLRLPISPCPHTINP
jgi:hypothetical protein